jgi:uncharacterized membrane protein YfcA
VIVHPAVAAAAALSGAFVGLILGLVGGGGSILAVPLLVYGVGIASPHVAIGTAAIAVAASAGASLASHARAGTVKWRCAAVFAAAGIAGATFGSVLAKAIDGHLLLAAFGLLMIGVGIMMLLRKGQAGDSSVRLRTATARRLLPPLLGIGFGVGLLSGFFGIGGGFLIVPGLMLATGMPLRNAVGTSLVAVAAFGLTTASTYALSGMVDWVVAALFVAGGLVGAAAGAAIGRMRSVRGPRLTAGFAVMVIVVGVYVVTQGIAALRLA